METNFLSRDVIVGAVFEGALTLGVVFCFVCFVAASCFSACDSALISYYDLYVLPFVFILYAVIYGIATVAICARTVQTFASAYTKIQESSGRTPVRPPREYFLTTGVLAPLLGGMPFWFLFGCYLGWLWIGGNGSIAPLTLGIFVLIPFGFALFGALGGLFAFWNPPLEDKTGLRQR